MCLFTAQFITVAHAHRVRHQILRPGKPFKAAFFKGDNDKTSIHLGVLVQQVPVGVVSLMRTHNAYFKKSNQYQLRGMAVLENYQRNGLGQLLIKKSEQTALEKGANLIWMNAREKASPFYLKCGYKIQGVPFLIKDVGIHYLMYKNLK